MYGRSLSGSSGLFDVLTDEERLLVEQEPVAAEGFDEIVVGVVQRYVDLAAVGNGAYAVAQDETSVLSLSGTIGRRGQCVEDGAGCLEIAPGTFALDVCAQFEQGRRRAGCG